MEASRLVRLSLVRAVILTEQPVSDHLGPGGGEYTLETIFARVRLCVPKTAAEGGILREGALSEAAICTFTYIETKAALGTSTLWAKATTRGPLTW
jgi:hypothetical protein